MKTPRVSLLTAVGTILKIFLVAGMIQAVPACGTYPAEVLQDLPIGATEEVVQSRLGAPVSVETLQSGERQWTYRHRVAQPIPVCRDIPVSDCVRGKFDCTDYLLRFNEEGILQGWQTRTCW